MEVCAFITVAYRHKIFETIKTDNVYGLCNNGADELKQ